MATPDPTRPPSQSTDQSPDLAPDPLGIHRTWIDANDQPRQVPQATVDLITGIVGVPPEDLEDRAPIVTRPGSSLEVGTLQVECEDGSARTLDGQVPEDFPLGYHWATTTTGQRRRLIVSPGRCWLPEDWRAWGWTVQLYAVRSAASWGIGDLSDLRTLREWSERLGAGFLLVNPLHAVGPTQPQEASPYLPATRRFRNPIYVSIDDVPGVADVPLDDLRAAAARVNDTDLVDRDAVWHLKAEALRRIFDARSTDGFERWYDDQGAPLHDFATWSALSLNHGPDWRTWPEELRDPRSDAVRDYAEDCADEVAFHAWMQWVLDLQLREACGDLTVIQDLPIGVSGGGSDAWARQEVIGQGVDVGAPPDIFNTAGQDWGSPPLVPWRLRLDDYEAFIDAVRGTIAGAGGLRVDHIMGLFRLWWVPADGSAADGAYLRYPSDDMLDIVALESHRANALVVGEDLGTVEPGVREDLADHAILSYRLLWFEDDEPAEWPVSAMAAITTHDLPTVAGLWSGADVEDQVQHTEIGRTEAQRGRAELLERLMRGGLRDGATNEEAVLAAHEALAEVPCVLVSATLEDALAVEDRPNMPGTTTRPNWCLRLPVTVEELVTHEGALAVARTLRDSVTRPPR